MALSHRTQQRLDPTFMQTTGGWAELIQQSKVNVEIFMNYRVKLGMDSTDSQTNSELGFFYMGRKLHIQNCQFSIWRLKKTSRKLTVLLSCKLANKGE